MQTKEVLLLKKDGKRQCKTCMKIYDNISDNFHVKRYHYNPDRSVKYTTYLTDCIPCYRIKQAEWRSETRKDYKKFIQWNTKSIRSRAKLSGLDFDLTQESMILQFENQGAKCFYTGQSLDFSIVVPAHNTKRTHPHRLAPSLDRLDPSKGYVQGNVVWCVYYVNRMKNDLSYDEFIDTCRTILERT